MAPLSSLVWFLVYVSALLAIAHVEAIFPFAANEPLDTQKTTSAPAATPAPAPAGPLNCTLACQFRCSKNGRPNRCHRACEVCCHRCGCVPPGTSGNQQVCGVCYTNQTTHGQALKCP